MIATTLEYGEPDNGFCAYCGAPVHVNTQTTELGYDWDSEITDNKLTIKCHVLWLRYNCPHCDTAILFSFARKN